MSAANPWCKPFVLLHTLKSKAYYRRARLNLNNTDFYRAAVKHHSRA